MEKYFLFRKSLVALLWISLGLLPRVASAQDIKIGSSTIDISKDYPDLLGDGKVSYSSVDKVLLLKDAKIQGEVVVNKVKGLTIKVEGESQIKSSKTALSLMGGSEVVLTGAHLEIVGNNNAVLVDMQGKLLLKEVTLIAQGSKAGMAGSMGFMGETIEIENSNVTVEGTAYYALGDLQTFTTKDVTITEPEGGVWNPANSRYCDSNGKVAKKVVMKAENQGTQADAKISFGQQVVDLTQSSNDLLGDGKVQYNKEEKQFTLQGYSATTPITIEEARGFSFVLRGNNFIETPHSALIIDKNSDITISGEGDLTTVSQTAAAIYIDNFSRLSFADTKISVKGEIGIGGPTGKEKGSIVIDSAQLTIMAEDFALGNLASFSLLHAKIAQPLEAYWNHEKCQLVDTNGEAVKHLVIETRSDNEGKNLGMLAIGSVYLDLNKSNKDVLGNGQVSYDAERRTLTLNHATIEAEQNALYMQEAGDLTINVVGDCSILSRKKSAIMLFCDSHLTITGSGKLSIQSPENCGIYLLYSNLLTIENADVKINGRWAIAGINGQSGEKVELINTRLYANGWQTGISSLAEITLQDTELVSPKGALWDDAERSYMYQGERVKELTFKRKDDPNTATEDISIEQIVTLTGSSIQVQGQVGDVVRLYNSEGRLLQGATITGSDPLFIDITDLLSGVYIVGINKSYTKVVVR